jgi:hypothetical protein
MSKLTGNEVTLALVTAAILLISAGLLGTIMASAQTSSSQATTSNNTTNTANNTAGGREGGEGNNAATVDSGNDTMISSMHRICSPAENNGIGAAAVTEMSSNIANTGATNASDGTMQGRPDPTNTTSAIAAGNNTTSPEGGNLTAIGESLSQARVDLLEGCNAVNNGDNNSALMQPNLVARALDNIEGNLTSIMATGGGNAAINVPPTGGTSTSSVEGATTAGPSSP